MWVWGEQFQHILLLLTWGNFRGSHFSRLEPQFIHLENGAPHSCLSCEVGMIFECVSMRAVLPLSGQKKLILGRGGEKVSLFFCVKPDIHIGQKDTYCISMVLEFC